MAAGNGYLHSGIADSGGPFVAANVLPTRVAVLGLGYVGLALARALGERVPTTGFDVNGRRIAELREGRDSNEIGGAHRSSPLLSFTDDPAELRRADFYVVAVPTPVDRVKRPDFSYLLSASALIGRALADRADIGNGHPRPIVVYESTVYPGCTEEICVPVIERESKLIRSRDFKIGYSPERINPGDHEHTLETVVKVVSGEDAETLERVAAVYGLVTKAGVHRAPDIRTAEAAKVIENIQRDINIALMNELSMLFHRLGIDLREVLKASKTKWNFLPFEPGLVGGHCIPEDPYYLTHKAQEAGYYPEIILAGRRINDNMGAYVAQQTVKLLIATGHVVQGTNILVLGVSFKENVRDVRNTKVLSLVRELEEYSIRVAVYDPIVGEEKVRHLGLTWAPDPFEDTAVYNAVVLAVPHKVFLWKGLDAITTLLCKGNKRGVLVDIKAALEWQNDRFPAVVHWTL